MITEDIVEPTETELTVTGLRNLYCNCGYEVETGSYQRGTCIDVGKH
jgi:hypothetical protein